MFDINLPHDKNADGKHQLENAMSGLAQRLLACLCDSLENEVSETQAIELAGKIRIRDVQLTVLVRLLTQPKQPRPFLLAKLKGLIFEERSPADLANNESRQLCSPVCRVAFKVRAKGRELPVIKWRGEHAGVNVSVSGTSEFIE